MIPLAKMPAVREPPWSGDHAQREPWFGSRPDRRKNISTSANLCGMSFSHAIIDRTDHVHSFKNDAPAVVLEGIA